MSPGDHSPPIPSQHETARTPPRDLTVDREKRGQAPAKRVLVCKRMPNLYFGRPGQARPVYADLWAEMRPSVLEARSGSLFAVRRSWPYALVLALALGATVAVGVNLSNAYPSEAKPFGWPGAANFQNGVAMVRKEILLAASLPALGLALASLRPLEPRRHTVAFLGGIVGADLLALALGVGLAGAWGAWAASKATWGAYWAFVAAHVLLAWAFYSLTLLVAAAARPRATAAALALYTFYLAVFDNLLQWRVFREAGYHRLQAGQFPDWFLAAQAGSPISAYRGFLILDWPPFRDGLENAVLKGATLPPWANAATFAGVLLGLWIVLPLGLTASVWKLRALWSAGLLRSIRREPELDVVHRAT
jgi:hypothetical protein